MSRVQLALNVSDVDTAVDFYRRLFGAEPAKRRPGYANFAIAEPPLKLVLLESTDARGSGVTGALNHLGVEVESADDVTAATKRLADEGLATATEENSTCCYATQDKVWVSDPDGAHPGRSTRSSPTHPPTSRAPAGSASPPAAVPSPRPPASTNRPPRPAAERRTGPDLLRWHAPAAGRGGQPCRRSPGAVPGRADHRPGSASGNCWRT